MAPPPVVVQAPAVVQPAPLLDFSVGEHDEESGIVKGARYMGKKLLAELAVVDQVGVEIVAPDADDAVLIEAARLQIKGHLPSEQGHALRIDWQQTVAGVMRRAVQQGHRLTQATVYRLAELTLNYAQIITEAGGSSAGRIDSNLRR